MPGTGYRWLRLTDGQSYASGNPHEVNLLNTDNGFCLTEWVPGIAQAKGGGTWADSALADGRRLKLKKRQNVQHTLTLEVRGFDTDDLARQTQTLRQLLMQAEQYWTTKWTTLPVYLEMRGVGETEMSYATIIDWSTPLDVDRYGDTLWQNVASAGIRDFELILELEPYVRSNPPGEYDCLEISALQAACVSYPLHFNGVIGRVDLLSPATLDDLPLADFTIDGWIKADGWGQNNSGDILDKTRWSFAITDSVGLIAYADFDGITNADARSGLANFTPDGVWHHVAAVFDVTSAEFTLYLDGEDVTATSVAGVGNYISDAAVNCYLGNDVTNTSAWNGDIGWLRLSDVERWTADFSDAVPDRCPLPVVDADTIWLGIYEGTGTNIDDLTANNNDGTATNTTWGTCCSEDRGNYIPCSPDYMIFDGATSFVSCGTNASIDDLPAADFTVEAWIRAYGYGESNTGMIANKGDWYFRVDNATGLRAFANFDTDDALSQSTLAGYSADSEWHHVAAVWSSAAKLFDLYVDGVETAYTTHTAGATNYISDGPDTLYLGNNAAGAATFNGDIQWVRISNSQRYTATFTVPARCVLPEDDDDTISVWTCGRPDEIVLDLYGPNVGTPTALLADCDCVTAGRDETCDDEVYVANKHNTAQLTHAFYDDGGTFSPNLFTLNLPYSLLPPVPAAADAHYIGINTSGPVYGPFCSAVYNLSNASSNITFSSNANRYWQYWNGAWSWIDTQDNTNADGAGTGQPFDTLGVRSVHWLQPNDWAVTTVNGVTGYWMRCFIDSVSTSAAPPVQQTQQIYSVLWPYVEIRDDKVGGDVSNLLRLYLKNQSDADLGATAPSLSASRVVAGLRSLSRGSSFSAYINLSDRQQIPGIVVASTAFSAFANDLTAATGRAITITALTGSDRAIATIAFDSAISQQYIGVYHMFVRVSQTSGAVGNLFVQLYGAVTAGPFDILTEKVSVDSLTDGTIIDLGRLTIPWMADINPDELGSIAFILYASSEVAVSCTFYEWILIPTDEWSIDAFDGKTLDATAQVSMGGRADIIGATNRSSAYLDIDSIARPKTSIRANLKYTATDLVAQGYGVISPQAAFLQARANQRIWMLFRDETSTPGIASQPEVTNSVQAFNVERFWWLRGDQ